MQNTGNFTLHVAIKDLHRPVSDLTCASWSPPGLSQDINNSKIKQRFNCGDAEAVTKTPMLRSDSVADAGGGGALSSQNRPLNTPSAKSIFLGGEHSASPAIGLQVE